MQLARFAGRLQWIIAAHLPSQLGFNSITVRIVHTVCPVVRIFEQANAASHCRLTSNKTDEGASDKNETLWPFEIRHFMRLVNANYLTFLKKRLFLIRNFFFFERSLQETA